MKFAGIIAEYDPFHNGHAWQLAQARALGAQRVAVAMSCGLTQRGALPLLPEAVRVQAALACGADLVFALPAPCACAGAEAFARAGVRILAAAGCDALVFGAENPDTALLQKAARVLCSEAYRTALKQQLAAGARSFAAARQAAVQALCPGSDVAALLDKPNNNLAVEYCKAIKAKKSTISKAKAKQEELKKYIFIIDEINRGEISKIFGELFFAIDPGYRGKTGEISTQYSNLHSDPGEKFYIPENVYIIGTMNEIDRSVDSFDFAMRRRFRFVELRADERLEMLASLENEELEAEAIRRMAALNKAIAEVEDLNENYQIGASYFLKLKTLDFDQLWTDYLQPLLQEYIQGMYDEEGIMNRFVRAYGYQKPARGDANEAAQDQG